MMLLRRLIVIAVGLAVVTAVILLTGGVVADSTGADSLAFFGVSVRTTSAQVFLTGALCTWMLFAASWLLTAGVRKSRLRTAQLAKARLDHRSRRAATAPPHRPPVGPHGPVDRANSADDTNAGRSARADGDGRTSAVFAIDSGGGLLRGRPGLRERDDAVTGQQPAE